MGKHNGLGVYLSHRPGDSCSARCSPITQRDDHHGLAAQGIKPPAAPDQVPDVRTLPAPVAHVIEHAYGTGVGEIFLFAAPLGLVALAAIALMREVPLGGKAASTSPVSGRHHPRPRSDAMSVATTSEPAAHAGRAPAPPPARRHRRLGQRRTRPERGDHRGAPRQRERDPAHRRPRPVGEPGRLVGPGHRRARPGGRRRGRLQAPGRDVARIPADIAVHKIYRRGKAGPEIVKAAKEGDYDAIILGARGVGRVGAMMGSVSSYVLHHADIAVFVAHAPRDGQCQHDRSQSGALPMVAGAAAP